MAISSTFVQAIRSKEFVISAELCLREDTGRSGVLEQAGILQGVVDAIAVPANPYGTIHMAGLAAAAILIGEGIDPILNIASRGRNRIALRSELLGAAATGVTSLILQRGDKRSRKARPKARKNPKVGSVKLLQAARRLSDYQKSMGEAELFLGTRSTILNPSRDWRPKVLAAKADAGAQFVQTRACLDIEKLRQYMAALVASRVTHRSQIIVSLPVAHSAAAARSLNEMMKGEVVPQNIITQLAAAQSPRQLGLDIAAGLLRELTGIPGVAGANLVPLGDTETIPAVIAAAGLDVAR